MMMDTVQQCLPFILSRLELLRQAPGSKSECLIIGISGLQGCGKSTLVGRPIRPRSYLMSQMTGYETAEQARAGPWLRD